MHELPHLFFGPSPARLSTAYYNALSSPDTFSDAVWKVPELQTTDARPRAVYIAWKGMLEREKQSTPQEETQRNEQVWNTESVSIPTTMPPTKWEKRARFDIHDSQCAEIEEMKTEEMREQYDTGYAYGRSEAFKDEIVDVHIRKMLEDCDLPQGLQIITEMDNAFGAVAAAFMEEYLDDNPKTTIFTCGLTSPCLGSEKHRKRRIRNIAKNTSQMLDKCTYIPINTKLLGQADTLGWSRYITSDLTDPDHSTAILGSALANALAPLSLSHDPLSLDSLARLLRPNQYSLASLGSVLPVPLAPHSTLEEIFQESSPWKKHTTMIDFFCDMHVPDHKNLRQVLTSRGIPSSIVGTSGSRSLDLDELINRHWKVSATMSYQIPLALETRPPYFPDIFADSLQVNGMIDIARKSEFIPDSVASLSSLHCCTHLVEPLTKLARQWQVSNIWKLDEKSLDPEGAQESSENGLMQLENVIADLQECR